MSKYWNETVKKIKPYVPGEQPQDQKYIKLNTNENPYPPSPKVIEAIKNAADDRLRLYPDPGCEELKSTLAEYYGLKKQQTFVGNGSDEILAFAFMAFFDPRKTILFPDITYTFYPVYSELFNIAYKVVPLDDAFNIPEELFYSENGGIVISNPKAPTAKFMPLDAVEKILENNCDSVVIIDEAYIDYGGESSIKLIEKYPNLLVIQTFSKSRSLAGLRVGFALGHEELIEGLERVKNSFNSYTLDRLALAGAVQAIKDEDYFQENRQKVISTREHFSSGLVEIGFEVIDSKANFVFISHPKMHASLLFMKLREKGILVRHFNKPRIDNYLRVSIGSDKDMDTVLEKLKEIFFRV